jgi:hypothetical protein
MARKAGKREGARSHKNGAGASSAAARKPAPVGSGSPLRLDASGSPPRLDASGSPLRLDASGSPLRRDASPAPKLKSVPPVAPRAPSVPPPAGVEEPLKTSVTIETAKAIVEAADAAAVAEHAADLVSGKPTALATGARVLEEVLARKPEMLVPQIERLVAVIGSPQKRAVQTAALALPVMARLAPARVARHLPTLTERFGLATDVAKDGLVATFAALCTASVAYQKRLEPVLEVALSTADPAVLGKWAETILPSLKGEPHARARAVVEGRLPQIPRALAQPIANFLGIKLRPATAAVR